jgi:hypothetical protein
MKAKLVKIHQQRNERTLVEFQTSNGIDLTFYIPAIEEGPRINRFRDKYASLMQGDVVNARDLQILAPWFVSELHNWWKVFANSDLPLRFRQPWRLKVLSRGWAPSHFGMSLGAEGLDRLLAFRFPLEVAAETENAFLVGDFPLDCDLVRYGNYLDESSWPAWDQLFPKDGPQETLEEIEEIWLEIQDQIADEKRMKSGLSSSEEVVPVETIHLGGRDVRVEGLSVKLNSPTDENKAAVKRAIVREFGKHPYEKMIDGPPLQDDGETKRVESVGSKLRNVKGIGVSDRPTLTLEYDDFYEL